MAVQVLQQVPYLNYLPDYMNDREYFGGQNAKDTFVFSFNSYWKHRNYLPLSSNREFSVAKYGPASVFYIN